MVTRFEAATAAHQQRCRQGATLRHRVRRMDAIEAYGKRCRVCFETDQSRLMIVPLEGSRWRARYPDPPPAGGRNKLAWLAKHGYPEGFGLVCSQVCLQRLRRDG